MAGFPKLSAWMDENGFCRFVQQEEAPDEWVFMDNEGFFVEIRHREAVLFSPDEEHSCFVGIRGGEIVKFGSLKGELAKGFETAVRKDLKAWR